MTTAPCLHPEIHHVQEHVVGSQAHRDCVFGDHGSSAASALPDIEESAHQERREPVTMTTASGFSTMVVPGQLDENARRLYTNGQCLALATQLSKRIGTNTVVVYVDEQDNGLIHAYAVGRQGDYYDIEGEHDPECVEEIMFDRYGIDPDEDQDEEIESFVCEEIGVDPRAEYPLDTYDNPEDEVMSFIASSDYLQYQDFKLADSFAESVARML